MSNHACYQEGDTVLFKRDKPGFDVGAFPATIESVGADYLVAHPDDQPCLRMRFDTGTGKSEYPLDYVLC